ncbi:hypothetical protein RDI58_022691 [Solanum bulbocastanum]|uniref:Uncharacterized protein n=1 Tax=Solanum bulbocastanum TaxID=147425 RepID=A0AAN8Y606_SOLBU
MLLLMNLIPRVGELGGNFQEKMAENGIEEMLDHLRRVMSGDKDEDEDKNDILNKHPYLLFLIVLVELKMKKIFLDELKASKFTQS